MVSGALSRGLAVLEQLAGAPVGCSVQEVAGAVELPKSAAHRILVNLVEDGWARQDPATGDYRLTLRMVSLALRHLADNTLVDLARPVLDRLAAASGELVRLSLVDGERLIWVAKAQGATAGLKYDPDSGAEARLSCTANGLAWLAGFGDERALQLMLRQGLADPADYGPNAPTTVEDFLARLRRARTDGYATTVDTFEAGASAIAAPVLRRAGGATGGGTAGDTIGATGGGTVGVLSIAGPTVRLSAGRMRELAGPLLTACKELTGVTAD